MKNSWTLLLILVVLAFYQIIGNIGPYRTERMVAGNPDIAKLSQGEAMAIFKSQQSLTEKQTRDLIAAMVGQSTSTKKNCEETKVSCEKSLQLLQEERKEKNNAKAEVQSEKQKTKTRSIILCLATIFFSTVIWIIKDKEETSSKKYWRKWCNLTEFIAALFYIGFDTITKIFGI